MKSLKKTKPIISIKVSYESFAQIFPFFKAPDWATNPLNPIDIIDICTVSLIEDGESINLDGTQILTLKPNTEYQFKVGWETKPPEHLQLNLSFAQIIFEQKLYNGDLVREWGHIFTDASGANGSVLVKNIDEGVFSFTTIDTSSSSNLISLDYTIVFGLIINNSVKKYLQIDPLIRTNSRAG